MPATPEDLFAHLDRLSIEVRTHRHPPVHTVEEAKRLRGDLPGAHCKNLLLRDHKRVLWLVVAREDRTVDLKALREPLGCGRLSFAKPDVLMETLGVEPGSVTPFAVINDSEGRVNVALDRGLIDGALVNFHPLTNDATTAISPDGLLAFLRDTGHEPRLIDL